MFCGVPQPLSWHLNRCALSVWQETRLQAGLEPRDDSSPSLPARNEMPCEMSNYQHHCPTVCDLKKQVLICSEYPRWLHLRGLWSGLSIPVRLDIASVKSFLLKNGSPFLIWNIERRLDFALVNFVSKENRFWHDMTWIWGSTLQIIEILKKWKDHKIIVGCWKVLSGWRYSYS